MAEKGYYGGECNRTACRGGPAVWFNPAMALSWEREAHKAGKFYYCRKCAGDIGAHAQGWRMVPPDDPEHPWVGEEKA